MKNFPQNVKTVDSKILDRKIYDLNTFEFLPDRQKQESYNKLFYKNLEEIKIIDLPIEKEKKLFYHFETNANASLTSTISQIAVTSEQLSQSNNLTYKDIKVIEDEIKELKSEIELVNAQFFEIYRPQIILLKINMQNFLVEQKSENFKLIREVAILEKEKMELQTKVYDAIAKLIKIEKEVGVKPSAFHHQLDSLLENKLMLDDH